MRLALGALAIAVLYLVFEFGRIQAGYNTVDAAAQRNALKAEISSLEGEIGRLNEQIVMLETAADIEKAAYKDVESSLVDLQAKIQEQQDAIAFYRGIVSPADGNAGLRVQDLKLSRADRERVWNIRVVLVQAMKHDRKVSGDVVLTIAGTEDGEPRAYSYSELLPEDADGSWAFSFRYFQDFDREVILPDGFTPEEVTISVQSRTRSIASIEESFRWASHLG
ncbi:MAG: DUF6776 family protein [Woeseiaceae bacterium]|jgi:hypothetical protein|nr:DUF6776 family protein [Woeseiaceae bacterium]